jgi:pyruvate/2-oxoacid:ferredoxin oxidoreductase alpha subunit
LASTARYVVKQLREKENLPVGLVKLRSVRPFPDLELRDLLGGMKAIAVLERDVSVGAAGIVYTELSRSLWNNDSGPRLINYIIGLGGRDVTSDDIETIIKKVCEERNEAVDDPVRWYQVRGL